VAGVESATLLLKGHVPEKQLPEHRGADKDKIRKELCLTSLKCA